MEYNYPQNAPTSTDPQSTAQPPQNQQQPTAARGRGRRQYAAQQYDFNAPASAPLYDQQAHYVAQGYQQPQPAVSGTQIQQLGQPPAQSYQYAQEYQAPGSNTYQQGYQGQPNVAGMTTQLQTMQVTQVVLLS
jgi:hypothetical protein